MNDSILLLCRSFKQGLVIGYSLTRKNVSSQRGHHGLNEAEFIPIDGVAHAWIETCGDVAAEPLQDFGGLLHSLFGDVGVYITTSEENGCTCE